MLLEIKTKESVEYIEVDRVEVKVEQAGGAKDTVYYEKNGINSNVLKEECEVALLFNDGGFRIRF